jgi:outer membrane protein assembly factor BamB
MPSPGPRRWLRWVLVAVAILAVAGGGAVAFVLLHSPGNVSHPNLSFTAPTSTTSTTSTATTKRHAVYSFAWPRYGFDASRSRAFNVPRGLTPPLRVGWRFNDYALLEFPPTIYNNDLFALDDDGSVKAIDRLNGHRIWERKVGSLAAASPAVGVREHMIFVPVLSMHGHSPGGGQIIALGMKNGHKFWAKSLPAGSESSPIVYGTTLYFGDQSGTVYSIRARDGHVNWTYHASAAVKGGPALSGGILYFGDYAGRAYALNAENGHQVWAVSTNGTRFGFGSGNFYSSPAVAFGRVYMGNTDGRVYSFAARSGQLAWATGTGAYVYSSPAVQNTSGLGPTVYMGSYDGRFYAFNAQSGAVRWSHASGGRISGSATIVDNVVYYSVLGTRTTIGLDARTGREVFRYPDGAFNPVVADTNAIYLVGYSMLYQMLPKRSAPAKHAAPAHKAAKPKPKPKPRKKTRKKRRM